jgi:cytoskeletal protein CcmA (bactofilin family)
MSDTDSNKADILPKRRFLDRRNSTPTLVAAGTHFEGDLRCAGDLSIAGQVHGNGEVQGMLSLAESGRWHGTAHCGNALLAGHMDGELVVNGKLEIRSSARISGKITAQQLAIAEGALVEADITVLSGAPIERFAEKRDA